MKRLLLASLLALGAAGCTTKTVAGPVTVTTKQLPEASRPDVARGAVEVTGESCSRLILLLIPAGFATAESAYADALSKAPGADTLVSYEARLSAIFITPFYYETCTIVHGYAISSKQLGKPG